MIAQEANEATPDFHRQKQVAQWRRDDKARRHGRSTGGR